MTPNQFKDSTALPCYLFHPQSSRHLIWKRYLQNKGGLCVSTVQHPANPASSLSYNTLANMLLMIDTNPVLPAGKVSQEKLG